jgi:hypothetical protein
MSSFNPSTTRSAPGCHPCLRYDLLPMSPGRTKLDMAEGEELDSNSLPSPRTEAGRGGEKLDANLLHRCNIAELALGAGPPLPADEGKQVCRFRRTLEPVGGSQAVGRDLLGGKLRRGPRFGGAPVPGRPGLPPPSPSSAPTIPPCGARWPVRASQLFSPRVSFLQLARASPSAPPRPCGVFWLSEIRSQSTSLAHPSD